MGLFTKECDICHKEKSGIKKNNKGYSVCADCRKSALKNMSINEYENANIFEISYASEGGSLNKIIEYCKNLNSEESLNELKPDDCDLNLKLGEICYYQGSARAYSEKNIVTGYKHSNSDLSFKIINGLYFRTGEGYSIPIRVNVGETFEGTLYITNLRIVLLTKKYGFDISKSDVNKIEQFKNGFRLYYKDKCSTIITYDNSTIFYVIDLLNKYLSVEDKQATSNKKVLKIMNDELYEKAKKLVIDSQKASASFIQLKLKIDYDTATKIMIKLENEEVVGHANGSNPRNVLIKK